MIDDGFRIVLSSLLENLALKICSDWFYPLHYSLTLNWMGLGYWIVGFAALIMLVALVSGVVPLR